MFKNISIFALAFAFIGLTGCEDSTTVEGDEVVPAEVETEVVMPADEMMEEAEADMEAAGEEMEQEMDEAGAEMEAAGEEMEAEMEEVIE